MASLVKPIGIATGIYTCLQCIANYNKVSVKEVGSLAVSFARDLPPAILAGTIVANTIKSYNNVAGLGIFFLSYGSLKYFDRARVSQNQTPWLTETVISGVALMVFLREALIKPLAVHH
ncbi:MAG: hypothetical protein KBA81_06730 [Rhabdochlamydiaceae bacterium]|nr:hypothetical protein [Rhabdochlamydiaceae bacterium]